ncbi:MAG TPA: isoprenylcysteine carboxylmethyltransferase family protein [Syntrophales bacterium]|nr:isoprenylcysteine carboxylmethyltransferase family protein [Syntrophales bacterium]
MGDSTDPNTMHHSGEWIPPPLIYAVVFAIGFPLQRVFPIGILPKVISRVIAFLCAGITAILAVWSIVWFRRAHTSLLPIKPSTALVTTGPYQFTRNPMYVSLAFLYAGLGLWFDVFWALVLLPVVIVIVRHYIITAEERYLEQKFGEEYLRYKARVRRWL